MTFQRRIFIAVTCVLALMLLANFFVSVLNARSYFTDQMAVLSQDAATSLAFSLSGVAKDDDQAQVESMLDVMFDSGYYLSISYANIQGKVVASRARNIDVEGVPDWFIRTMDIPLSSGSAEVQSGWFRLGAVHIVAHPGFGYQNLWRVVAELFWVFLFAVVLTYGLIGLLMRTLLRPLLKLERQAEFIARENFYIERNLPSEPEFKRVVVAMNSMALKIQTSFRQQLELVSALRKDTHIDGLTGLPNRSDFDSRINAWLASEEGQGIGCLILISLNGLDEINRLKGREFADDVLLKIASVLKHYENQYSDVIIGRRSGTDFALYIPALFSQEVESFAKTLRLELINAISFTFGREPLIHLGVAHSLTAVPALHYLTGADESLRQNCIVSNDISPVDVGDQNAHHRTAQAWLPILERVIETGDLQLFFQPVYLRDGISPHHWEVLCRIDDEGELINAGVFWPLIERFGLSERFDQMILESVLTFLENNSYCKLSMNVSVASAHSMVFRQHLAERLNSVPEEIRNRLILELPENLFNHVDVILKPLVDLAASLKVAVCIDHFGFIAASIAHLNQMPIAFVKLDRRFIIDIDQHHENKFYVRMLYSACMSCDVVLLAEGVEKFEELDALKALEIGGYQGYYLGRPDSELR